jgi:glycosyltransferase involved in cell wall biosynthesis
LDQSAPRVLLIASDTVAAQMAGTGIRYWNLAREIGRDQPVTLATPNESRLALPPGVTLHWYGADGPEQDAIGQQLAELVERHDVVVAQHLPYLYTDEATLRDRFLIVDLYAPWILEKLEFARIDPDLGEPNRRDDVAILNRLLALGDAFLCASERQRDFWLGALAAAGRLELAHAQHDPELRDLIAVVPFGLPPESPIRSGPGPRARFPEIAPDDPLVLWNGGIWNWLDPLTAIRAIGILAKREPRVRLVFMGVRSPVARVAEMRVVEDARTLARALGLLDRNVFFNDWVSYAERQNWLLDADLGLSLHVATLEARFAFRTRMLDNLWCRLPLVATAGDVLAETIESEHIGLTVPPGDANAVAEALAMALQPDRLADFRANLDAVAGRYTWARVSEPLRAWCRHPQHVGQTKGTDPAASYVHHMERMYSETAEYARHLERVVAQQQAALQGSLGARIGGRARRALGRVRSRRDG